MIGLEYIYFPGNNLKKGDIPYDCNMSDGWSQSFKIPSGVLTGDKKEYGQNGKKTYQKLVQQWQFVPSEVEDVLRGEDLTSYLE